MTRPRKSLISLVDTPYYHIGSRCVRRTFLCGQDKLSGRCYEHRRQWIVDRVRLLSSVFAIDIGSYAIMSNHYHLVVKLDPDQLTTLSNDDIINRWLCLFKGPILVQRFRAGEALENAGTDTFQLTTYSALITMNLCQTLKGFNHDSTKEVAHFAC